MAGNGVEFKWYWFLEHIEFVTFPAIVFIIIKKIGW
ncbi:hypothetical protein BSF41_12760 [Flavobacterium sp. ACN2]|jgi:hypothetical protein|nr:hypothetical protein BSF41_12760 [Flavobacterium sp. ACN2]